MEPSPLTQQTRPDSFQPKVVKLYDSLFKDEDEADKSEGFWQEFFLLKPDGSSLRRILDELSADDLIHLQAHSQELLLRAIERIKSGVAPTDEVALETLTVFLDAVLRKKYTNPSSDIISVLAGLHDADVVLYDLVGALDGVIRNGRDLPARLKALRVALTMTSGAYQTGLVSYFWQRDLFPSLMKFVQDSETPSQILEPFVLLGLLTNYNKFEFQNPYRLRLDDFVNDAAIKKIVVCAGATCHLARDKYVAVQDDLPEGWTLTSTLSYLSFGVLAPRSASSALSAEEAKVRFTELPGPEAAVLISTYEFSNANKLFCYNLVTMPPENKGDPSPFSAFLSLTSYLFQHAHRTSRASYYTYINLFILQILLEDPSLAKRICSDESKLSVRLCRQRQPYLPVVRGDRVAAANILDIIVDGMNHNLRRRLDTQLYLMYIGVLTRMISFLSRSRAKLTYHWSELWRSLLSFIRFLNTYASDVKPLIGTSTLVDNLVNLIALLLSTGEAFLPEAAAYDDLFYKLVETGDILTKFRDAYDLSKHASSSSINTLISVSSHYHDLLESEGKGKSGRKNLSPKEVGKVIKQGYETLSIEAKEGLDRYERFREADYRSMLKRMARIAVEDAKDLVEIRKSASLQ